MKELLLKNKGIIISLVAALGIGIVGGRGDISQSEYESLLSKRESQIVEISEIDKEINEAKDNYDTLLAQKEEQDRIAKEEAERKAKEEAERKAKEEAERKAEEERLAKEEAERKAEEERLAREEAERIAAEQAAQESANAGAGGYGGGYETTEPTGQMVWLSETGEKYHSINNCGRMNPNKARQVTLESAKARYGQCTKCW